MSMRRTAGLWGCITAFGIMLLLPVPDGLTAAGQAVAAVAVLMAVWWIAEVLPLAATALLPVILFPLLGVVPADEVTSAYSHHLIFLFLGGFMIAVTLERWDLHRRLALQTINLVGSSPVRLLLGFMLATAFLSMWISNTATVMMMVPIAAAVAGRYADSDMMNDRQDGLASALMLGVAYSATIGGIATLIGTPPNAILAGMIEELYGSRITFATWMTFGLPLSLFFLVLTWLYLWRFVLNRHIDDVGHTVNAGVIRAELEQLGTMSTAEKRVLIVFVCVALTWILRGLTSLEIAARIEDSTIAVLGALALFLLPAGQGQRLLDWDTAKRIPWDILLLFGGGFALARGFEQTGLSEWLGQQLQVFDEAGPVMIVALVAVLVKFLTEITSNTATATLLIPIMAAFAEAAGLHPYVLMVTTAISASLAFMLPVATPPNAIIFGTPYITVPLMARVGFWLNLLAVPVTTLFIMLLLPWVWNIPVVVK